MSNAENTDNSQNNAGLYNLNKLYNINGKQLTLSQTADLFLEDPTRVRMPGKVPSCFTVHPDFKPLLRELTSEYRRLHRISDDQRYFSEGDFFVILALQFGKDHEKEFVRSFNSSFQLNLIPTEKLTALDRVDLKIVKQELSLILSGIERTEKQGGPKDYIISLDKRLVKILPKAIAIARNTNEPDLIKLIERAEPRLG